MRITETGKNGIMELAREVKSRIISCVLVCAFIVTPVLTSFASGNKKTDSNSKCSMTDYTVKAMPGLRYADEIQELLDMYFSGERVFPKNGVKTNRSEADAILEEFRNAYTYCQTTAVYYFGNDAYIVAQDTNTAGNTANVFSWADSVIGKLGIGTSTKQKDAVRKINNYLCEYLHYDFTYKTGLNSVWEGIQNRTGTCAVYSVLFQILCQKCGIECYTCHPQKNHIRNYVLIGGERLYVDVTWNDPLITLNGVSAEIEDRSDLTSREMKEYRSAYLMFVG